MVYKPISSECVHIDGETIWMYAGQYNMLMSKKVYDNTTCIHGRIPWITENAYRLYSSMYCYNNRIYLIPNIAEDIAVYDIEKAQFYKIELNQDFGTSLMSVVCVENRLFCFGFNSSTIICLDMNMDAVEYITGWYTTIKDYVWDNKAPFFRNQVAFYNGVIYAPLYNANVVLIIDVETLQCECRVLEKKQCAYSAALVCGENILLIPRTTKEPLCVWNLSNDKLRFIVPITEFNEEIGFFIGARIQDSRVYLYISSKECITVKYDCDITILMENNGLLVKQVENGWLVEDRDSNLVLYTYDQTMDGGCFEYDINSLRMYQQGMQMYIEEREECDLEHFIEISNVYKAVTITTNRTGMDIYNSIKGIEV